MVEKKKVLWLVLIACLFVFSGCVSPPVAAATAPVKTDTLPPPSPSPVPSATITPTVTLTPTPTPSPTPTPAVWIGAGDIAVCGVDSSAQTAALLEQNPGEIFTAGDNSNDDGALYEFNNCFGPTWGRFKDHIHPAPGNHEYITDSAAPYYEYFGQAAGQPGQGWYSYEYGGWHIVVLNSNCNDVACGKESPQVTWLREDLSAHPAQCTLAIWHHPRWSSGLTGSDGRMSPAYRVLYEAGAEIVISGHDHDYERLAPLDPTGKPDPQHGIRQFVVGTGGAEPRPFATILPESEAHQSGTFGVLKFSLYPDHYDWQFLPVSGETFTDSGTAACH
jgi:acid phosphatase type 7